MSVWPKLSESAPGSLVRTSGSEWLPEKSPLPVFYEGWAFLPDELPAGLNLSEILGAVWNDIEEAITALSQLDGTARNLPNPHLLSRSFSIREAQASSRMENTIASAEEVALAEVGEDVRKEGHEVRNYLHALEQGLLSPQSLGQSLLRNMHQVLLSGPVRGGETQLGRFRTTQAYIAGERRGFASARFVPPPAEHVPLCMDKLDQFIREADPRIPRLVAIAITHYQFETIHPFSDGNGRLGRMLIMMQLCRSGLLSRPLLDISSFLDMHRDTYCDLLLNVSLEGRFTEWIVFLIRGIAYQAKQAQRRTEYLLELRKRFIDAVTEPRSSALLRELVDWLFTRPAVRVSEVAKHLNVSPQAAQRHVDRLIEKGILTEITGRSYNRVYLAGDILRAIETDLEEADLGSDAAASNDKARE